MASRHNEVVKQDRAQADLRVARALLDEKTAQLLAKTEQLLTMLGSISQGIMMIGEDGRLNTFNTRVCELLELPESYLRSRPTLAEIGSYQMERGDFGSDAAWVEPHARNLVGTDRISSTAELYLRTRRDGRVLEVKTQPLASGGMVRTFTDVTDYMQAEQARRRSNALLQAAQALAGVGGMEIDLVTGNVYWTDEVYRLLDTTPAEFSPTAVNAFDFFAPEWVPVVKAAIRNAELNVGLSPPALEAEMITAKGRRIWVRARSTLTLADGRAVKRTSVVQDITAQKQSETSLRASEELLRQITSQVPGMVYRVLIAPDGSRHYSFVGPGVRELYDVSPEDVLADGDLLVTFTHPDDRPQVGQEMASFVRHGQPLTSEFRILLRNGTQKWVQMTSAVVSADAQGMVRSGVVIDITARKQAEGALRERDDLWKLALESTGDGVWDWYVQTGVELFSRRCLEMYGFTEGELADRPDELDRRTHPDDVEQMRRDRQAHFDGLTPTYTNEHRIRCKDGSWKWIMSRGMVISRDEQGRPLRMTGTHTDITARKNTEALIWKQANFDALTGLPNRRKLRHQLAKDLISSRNAGLQLALLFIDLDHFKEVNDTLGHDQGDALLVQAAQRIRQCVHDRDTVARMGGDEFTVVLPALGQLERVEQVVQRIIDALAAAFQLGEEQAFVSASIGITLYPDDAIEIDSLFKHADQALYVAKDNGRNCFSYYTPALQEAAQTRVRLANDLRNALAEGQLWVAYQPIVELATGVTHKAEALVRWQHPTRGLVSPAQFIPIAETSGMIIDIGEWVFRQAAHQVGEWRQRHHPRFQISVNKSPLQFHNRKESHLVWFDYLQALGLPGQSIALEITEGLLLDASAAVNGQLLAFRDAGIAVALDDFGTGYSSLSYLQQYDIDYLKIDQSFVRGLATGSKDLALCKAIIVMAHELGMKVIAEGVETPAQRDLLQAAGCDYGQGYLFARPMPASEFGVFLAGEQT